MSEVERLPGQFRLLRLLKREFEIETFLGEDEGGSHVLVKVVPRDRLDRATLQRIQREADALRGLEADGLAPTIWQGEQGDQLWVVRRFVRGMTLLEKRAAQDRLSVEETVAVAQGLFQALRAAHDRGVLHLNVKPSNIVVEGRRVTLVDFSVRRRPSIEDVAIEAPAGDIRYMAPELLGLVGREVGEGADLYAAGIVLYECLAGRLPYEGTTAAVLRQHAGARPLSFKEQGLAVPRLLDALVHRLLRKDPRDRYQSADEVLADLALLERGVRERGQVLVEPVLIGRDQELEALVGSITRAAEGRGCLVLLEAEAGMGKTRLIEEAAGRVGARIWVLRGQGVESSAERPLQLLSGVVAGILEACRSDPLLVEGIRRRIGAQLPAVCDAVPQLVEILGPSSSSTAEGLGPEAFGETRSVRAIAALIDALGDADAPAALLLDDCQWADEASLKVLQHWWANSEASNPGRGPARHVSVMAAFRSEEVPPDHLLRRIRPAAHLVLPALAARQVRSLVESMAGPIPDEALATVVHLSAGNPLMASVVLRGLVESGALLPAAEGWSIEPSAFARAQTSRTATDFLTGRIESLPGPVRGLLAAAAVLGKEFDLELAASLAGVALPEALGLLQEAQRRRMVWAKRPGRFEFFHDRLREALLAATPQERRRALHQRAAELFDSRERTLVFELAYHFDAAGLPERAAPYAMAAAEQARAQYALQAAERAYRIAERGADRLDPVSRFRLYLGLAEVLHLRGVYAEALRWFDRARPLATHDSARARIESEVAEVAFKTSDYEGAMGACAAGLRLLGRRSPTSTAAFLVLFLWEILVQVLHRWFPRAFLARRRPGTARAEADLLAVSLYDRLAILWYFSRAGKLASGWAALRALNLAESYPPTVALGREYFMVANIAACAMPPLRSFCRRLGDKGRAVQESIGTLHGRGQALSYLWPIFFSRLEFDEGIAQAEEGLQLLRLTGDQWDVNAAHWGIALGRFHQGDARASIEECRRLYHLAREIGDHQNVANALWVWAQASQGELPIELIDEALVMPGLFVNSRIVLLAARGIALLARDRPAAAVPPLGEACRLVLGKRLIDWLLGDVLSWHAMALRRMAEQTPLGAGRQRKALLSLARRRTFQARLCARIHPHLRPFALRESGVLAAVLGREAMARRYLDRAVAEAAGHGLRLQHALTLGARAELGRALGWAGADADRDSAERELLAMHVRPVPRAPIEAEARVALALVERLSTLLAQGRAVLTALTKDTVIRALGEATLALLRAERCRFLDVSIAEGAVSIAPSPADDGGAGVSYQLVQRAVAQHQPLLGDGAEERTGHGAKSAIAIPVTVRGRVVGCLYAEHSQIAGFFREEDVRLAGFIATLGGAALENTEGFQQVQEAVRVRDEFLSIASHELRTPLTPLQLQLESLGRELDRRGVRDERLAAKLESARRQVFRLARLVETLLDVSRITTGRLTIEPEVCDLAEIAGEVRARFADRAKAAGCRIELCADRPVKGRWDRLRIEQVLDNLLDNALKYAPGGPVQVSVEATDGTARLSVRDYGIGISPGDMARIFGRFERAVPIRHYGGFGLGLYIARQIVEAHGGSIAVESQPGAGSTFTVNLPR